MKVTDVVKQLDTTAVLQKIMDRYKGFPQGSISPRESVFSKDYGIVSREEAEEIVAQLDTTVTSAIMDFKYKPKKK